MFHYLEHHLLAVAAQSQPNARAHYVRHRPEQTALYQLIQQHAATFFVQAQDATGSSLPRYVKDEFDAFLECGILAHGFLRLHCGGCKQDQLVAFSCKRRGFCPSFGAKRMSETAASLVDHVIPSVPVCQWVLSPLIALRVLFAARPNSVTLIQRFGLAANLNIHLHCLVLDGVYQIKPNGELVFSQAPASTEQALQLLLRAIITSLMKRLVRQGVWVQEQDDWYVADSVAEDTEASALRPLQHGSVVYRIAFGPRAGRKVLTLREVVPIDTDSDYERKPLCANEQGFSLHAAVRCHANERLKLERLCRYITRPALANDRVKINAKGQVELKLKTPWRDGTTHHVLSAIGVVATAGGIGAKATVAFDSISRGLVAKNGTECKVALAGGTATAKGHQSIASSCNQRARSARTRSAHAFGLGQAPEAGVQRRLHLLPTLRWGLENRRSDFAAPSDREDPESLGDRGATAAPRASTWTDGVLKLRV